MGEITRLPINSVEMLLRAYTTGALFAGYHFVQQNPEWYCKLREGLVYTVSWPYRMVPEWAKDMYMESRAVQVGVGFGVGFLIGKVVARG